jgi:peptidoglycan/xylan/chitin deacetylase (PgdA/CDA1 family)
VNLGLELAYFSGLAKWAELRSVGAGAILKFERVRPAQPGRFRPLRSKEITPRMLDRMVLALRRWNIDIVSLDELISLLSQPPSSRRFVCLTFDGAYRDLVASGYPVLARHRVPFTVYLPTAFPDRLGEAWWLALEQVIAGHERVALVIGRNEQRFDTAEIEDKEVTFEFLQRWMRSLPPAELRSAIHDLCRRYSVDLAASSDAFMDWGDIAKLAADPLVSFGTATVNFPTLRPMKDGAALREMTMGRAVARAALGRDVRHFSFPFGDPDSFGPRHIRMAADAGFASAVTTVPGLLCAGDQPELHALPRIAWDGRDSLRVLRVILSGLTLRAKRQVATSS